MRSAKQLVRRYGRFFRSAQQRPVDARAVDLLEAGCGIAERLQFLVRGTQEARSGRITSERQRDDANDKADGNAAMVKAGEHKREKQGEISKNQDENRSK